MDANRWILSLAIVYHLTALTIDAIPPPEQILAPVATQRPRVSGDGAAYAILTRGAAWLERVVPPLFRVASPLRSATQPYVSAGLRQRWSMFSNPLLGDQYIRLDYYVESEGANRPRVYRELVFPVDREDKTRLIYEYRNKAVMSVVEAFLTPAATGDTRASGESTFEPLIRYFTARFTRSHLHLDDRVTGITFWYGLAPNPAPDSRVLTAASRERQALLERYYAGPAEIDVPALPPRVGNRDREADIVWSLLVDKKR